MRPDGVDVGARASITRPRRTVAAGGTNQDSRLFEAGGVQIGQKKTRAELTEPTRDSASERAGGARDERDPSIEPEQGGDLGVLGHGTCQDSWFVDNRAAAAAGD